VTAPATPTPTIISRRKAVQKAHKKTIPSHPINPIKKRANYFKALDASAVQNPLILLDFIRWSTVPRSIRNPQNQKEFATKCGVDTWTLSQWRHLPHFWDEVAHCRDTQFRKYTSDVYYGLVKRAKLGSAREVELFAKLFEGFSEKLRVQEEQPSDEMSEKDVREVAAALTNIGLREVIRMNKWDDEEVE